MKRWLLCPTVARRELAAYFHSPIAYVVGVLFLAVQGFSFWAVTEVLADPSQRAPVGAVLGKHFGGTVLYWAVLFLVVSVISMRLVAEDKRLGIWEALATTPIGEGVVLVGKWLGAIGFYLILWLPTGLYLWVLHHFAPAGAGFDPGPVASAYLGVAVSGVAFLALGLAASAATANQIIAVVVTYVLLLGLLLFGQLGEIVPSWVAGHPDLAAVLEFIDVRGHMARFASGDIGSGPLVFYALLAVTGLIAARALVAMGRRRRAESQARWVESGLVVVSLVAIAVLAGRHPRAWDVSAGRVNSLDPQTRAVLQRVEQPIDLLVIRPGLDSFASVQAELDGLLDRMVEAQPLLHRRDLDPAREPDRIESLAVEFAISVRDLADGGGVVVQRGDRRRVVDLLDMAGFARDDLGVGTLARFRAEAALAGAIAELTQVDRPVLCATSGHGELPFVATPDRPDWSAIAARAERDGARLEAVGSLAGEVPPHCRVLVVFGPVTGFRAVDAMAVARYLERGGRLLLVVATPAGPPPWPASGLELPLADYGIVVRDAVAVDPAAAVDLPWGWLALDGYSDHPIAAPFQARRPTVWQRARVIDWDAQLGAERGARGQPLVSTGPAGWGESRVAAAAPGGPDRDDLPGPVAVAVAVEAPAREGGGTTRLVVVGSARSLSSEIGRLQLGVDDLFGAAALSWLSGRSELLDIGDKTPETLRLVMTRRQLRITFVLVVVVIPFGFAVLGGLVWRRRRRE